MPAGVGDAEERRLFYVAMTRARDRLILTRATRRFWRGEIRALPPSSYLGEIPETLVTQNLAPLRKKRVAARQYSLF